MPRASKPKKVPKLNKDATRIILSDGSNDSFSDLTFLTSHINAGHALLSLLLSDRMTNRTFSELHLRSQSIGWKQTLIEERDSINSDPKSKLKRFMFNSLIHNTDELESQVEQLNEMIAGQMATEFSVERGDYIRVQQGNGVQNEIKAWYQLQSRRRLSSENCDQLCNLIILQRLATDQFIHWVNMINFGLVSSKDDGVEALRQLVEQSFFIVTQPSGTDCVAVTKYEKQGKDFVAKIKTRIICLLDSSRIGDYLELLPIDVTLFLKQRGLDPSGDVQSSLIWKTRIITDLGQNQNTFLYAELNETNLMQLTRKNTKGKPLYNKELCQLEFGIHFKINLSPLIYYSVLTSQSFGLCSHAKSYPEYLAKVFLEEMTDMCTDINVETHVNTLVGHIGAFYKRITSVEAKSHTTEFIQEELQIVYDRFRNSTESVTKRLTWNIYQSILEKLFTQIRFLGNHPFLAMMYHDSLFHGICNGAMDYELQGTQTTPQMIMRFEIFPEQKIRESCNIIVVIKNGRESKSCISAHYFIDDMCTCFSEARHNEARKLEIFHRDRRIPFSNVRQYYDNALSHDDLNETIGYEPLRPLLRKTIRNIPVPISTPSEQQSTVYLTGLVAENSDMLAATIEFLREQLAQWCEIHNRPGLLTIDSTSAETMNSNEFPSSALTRT